MVVFVADKGDDLVPGFEDIKTYGLVDPAFEVFLDIGAGLDQHRDDAPEQTCPSPQAFTAAHEDHQTLIAAFAEEEGFAAVL